MRRFWRNTAAAIPTTGSTSSTSGATDAAARRARRSCMRKACMLRMRSALLIGSSVPRRGQDDLDSSDGSARRTRARPRELCRRGLPGGARPTRALLRRTLLRPAGPLGEAHARAASGEPHSRKRQYHYSIARARTRAGAARLIRRSRRSSRACAPLSPATGSALEQVFQVTFAGTLEHWTLTLVPLDAKPRASRSGSASTVHAMSCRR